MTYFYEPKEDSFLIEEAVENFLEKHAFNGMKILEVGTGSGIIIRSVKGLLKKKQIKANLYACDINRNIVITKCKCVNFLLSDLFSSIKEKFDLIIFNPPYLPESNDDCYLDSNTKKSVVGGKKGYETILRFLEKLPRHLKRNGACLLLISSLTGKDVVEKKLSENFKWKIIKEKSLFFEKLYVYMVRISIQ
jgi:release factor glutamine methyltransferase